MRLLPVLLGMGIVGGVWLEGALWRYLLLLVLDGKCGLRRGLADAGERRVNFFLRQVFGAQKGDALLNGRAGHGRVLQDWDMLGMKDEMVGNARNYS